MKSPLSAACFLICLLLVGVAPQGLAQDDYVRFQIAAKPTTYLHVENAEPSFGEVKPGWLSARWELRLVEHERGRYAIRSLWTGKYLTMVHGKLTTVADLDMDPRTGESPHLWTVKRQASDAALADLSLAKGGGRIAERLRIEQPIAPPAGPEYPKLDSTDYVRLQLTKQPDHYLHVEKATPEFGAAGPGWISARWELKPAGRGQGQYALRSLWTGKYLTMDKGQLVTVAEIKMDPKTGESPDLWIVTRSNTDPALVTMKHSGSSKMLPMPIKSELRIEEPVIVAPVKQVVYHRLKSATVKNTYVHIETGPPAAGPITPGWFSAQWEISEVGGGRGRFVVIKNRWTGAYLLVQHGKLTMGDATVDARTGKGPHIWQVTGQARDASQLTLQHVESGAYLAVGKPQAGGGGHDLLLQKNGDASAWHFELVK